MNCAEADKYIYSYKKEELNDQLQVQLKSHILVCGFCRVKCLMNECCQKLLATKLPTYSASGDLKSRIASSLDAQRTSSTVFKSMVKSIGRPGNLPTVIGSVVVAALVIGLVFSFFMSRPSSAFDQIYALHNDEFEKYPISWKTSDLSYLRKWVRDSWEPGFSVPDLSEKQFTLIGGADCDVSEVSHLWIRYENGPDRLSLFLCGSGAEDSISGERILHCGKQIILKTIGSDLVAKWGGENMACIIITSLNKDQLLSLLEIILNQNSN